MSATDIQNSPRETVAAAVLSLLIHLLLIVGIALTMLLPGWHSPPPVAPEEEPPLELTILPEPLPNPSDPSYVRTTDQNIKDAPENAPFESDNNTRAASTDAPSGTAPMPSVAGEDSPALDLENKSYTAGTQSQAAQSPSEPSPPQEAQEPPAKTDSAPPTQLALREAPKPDPTREEQAKPKKPQTPAAQPKPPSAPGFQPETRVTRIRGNISNRGRASVEAASTPLGRYKKTVSDAIGSRWYYYVNNQIGLLNIGTVDIRFRVNPDGKVVGTRVISNTSNESFASVSITSILEAEIPPIPEEVAKLLDNGRLEIDYSFTILSN